MYVMLTYVRTCVYGTMHRKANEVIVICLRTSATHIASRCFSEISGFLACMVTHD